MNPSPTHTDPHRALLALANPEKAAFLQRFFKTGKGEYAEGDRFLGIMVPSVRQLSRQFKGLPLPQTESLLHSRYNEERLLALLLLNDRFKRGTPAEQKAVYDIYLSNIEYINNWNLVDASAPYIVGPYLLNRSRTPLYRLARSRHLWKRRIAIISTFCFIRKNDFTDTLKLVEQLLTDEQDLIHKACGWMLREIGKRDTQTLEVFLQRHVSQMPRTLLRYAIERLPERKRKKYLERTAPPH